MTDELDTALAKGNADAPGAADAPAATSDGAAVAAEGRLDVPPVDPSEDGIGREPGDIVLALSPRQIIGGFALLAGLIIMLRRRGRRKG